MNKNLIESLDKHISKVNEVGEDVTAIEKDIYKKAKDNLLGKLIWALIKPTVVSQGGKFIAPNFNSIKPLLVSDIKNAVLIMQKEFNMPKEEAIGCLLDPSKYDDEVGNYADTTFAEPASEVNVQVVSKHLDDMINYLDREIKKNSHALITAVK